jgi:hypothetical protein
MAASLSPSAPVSDATSVDTPDWACIRWYESGDDYSRYNGGAYQFEDFVWEEFTGLQPPAEAYAPLVQDRAALALYAYDTRMWGNGFHAWATRWVCGLG